jgi:hypothetical protein
MACFAFRARSLSISASKTAQGGPNATTHIRSEAGVDKNTAAQARRKLEARGESHHVEKREDTKGRKQPSSKRGKGKKSLNFVTAAEQATAHARLAPIVIDYCTRSADRISRDAP